MRFKWDVRLFLLIFGLKKKKLKIIEISGKLYNFTAKLVNIKAKMEVLS